MSSTIQTDAAIESETAIPVDIYRLTQYGLLVVIVASVANALIRVAALAVLDIPATFLPLRGFTFVSFPLGWGPVVLFSAIGAIGATIVYGVITRYSTHPNRMFTIVATLVLLLSFGAFLAPLPVFAGAPSAAFAALAIMHVTVAAASIGILTRALDSEGGE